jgi:hypothetical protein
MSGMGLNSTLLNIKEGFGLKFRRHTREYAKTIENSNTNN